jgi:hypothetical protein
VAAGALATLVAALAAPQARAQTNARPSITVAPTLSAEPASQAALPIRVGPPDAVPRNSFLRLRGLPPMAALSEGHSIAPGAWAVPLSVLPDLKVTLPAGATGRSEIVITLVAIDGTVLAEEKSTLAVGGARAPEKAAEKAQPQREAGPPAVASILRAGAPLQTSPTPPDTPERSGPAPQPAPSTAPPAMSPQDRDRAMRLMKKGDEQMAEGNVAGARLFYERAADAGLAQAAMALAGTFDAAELARLNVRGVPPDAKSARRWYERARQLGAGGAEERLKRIGGS